MSAQRIAIKLSCPAERYAGLCVRGKPCIEACRKNGKPGALMCAIPANHPVRQIQEIVESR